MLGLIKKDLLITKGNLKIIAIIFIVFAFMAVNGNGDFTFIPSYLSVMIMMTTFSYDEYNKTDAFISTFPKGKQNSVKSKYLSTLLIILITTLLTFIVSIIVGHLRKDLDLTKVLVEIVGCFIGVSLLVSIMFPFIYKFGIEKSRIGMFIGIFGIIGLASIIMKSSSKSNIPKYIVTFFSNYWIIIMPIVIIIMLLTSYKISKKIYLKKEF